MVEIGSSEGFAPEKLKGLATLPSHQPPQLETKKTVKTKMTISLCSTATEVPALADRQQQYFISIVCKVTLSTAAHSMHSA